MFSLVSWWFMVNLVWFVLIMSVVMCCMGLFCERIRDLSDFYKNVCRICYDVEYSWLFLWLSYKCCNIVFICISIDFEGYMNSVEIVLNGGIYV